MAKIGLQLYTLHEMAQGDLLGTLSEVAKIGFDGVEFAGYFGLSAAALRKRLDDLGMAAAGSHISQETLSNSFPATLDFSREIGLSTVTCTGFPDSLHKDRESWQRLAGMLDGVGRKCRENGLRCGYQNHDFEFQKVDKGTALDVLMAHTDPKNVFLELDTFWAEYCGYPPAGLIAGLRGRCRYLHMTDMKERGEKQNTEAGRGVMDLKSVADAGRAAGVEWYIVKQIGFEMPPLESLAVSLRYLRGLLSTTGRGGKE